VADERAWRVELTADDVPELQVRLEWALQHQNLRLTDRLDGMFPPDVLRKLLLGLSILGLSILVLYVGFNRSVAQREPLFVFGGGAVFVVALVVGIVLPRVMAVRRRFAGRALARTADRAFRKVRQRVPYAIEYRLGGGVLVAQVGAKVVRRTELSRAGLVLDAGRVLFVFRFRGSVAPFRYVYVDTDEDRVAAVTAFLSAGAKHVVLAGPIEGFTAPVPEARVRSG
jgi:hypothetical protein